MIKPEQIPDEVMAAFNDAWFNQGLTTRECLAAAIALVRKAILEEAAKVAESEEMEGAPPAHLSPEQVITIQSTAKVTARSIARKIRKLVEE